MEPYHSNNLQLNITTFQGGKKWLNYLKKKITI